MITGTAAQCGVVLDGKDFLVTGTQLQPKCQNCNMIYCVALDSEYDFLTFVHMWLFLLLVFFPLKKCLAAMLLTHYPPFTQANFQIINFSRKTKTYFNWSIATKGETCEVFVNKTTQNNLHIYMKINNIFCNEDDHPFLWLLL